MHFFLEKTAHSPLIRFENGLLLIAGRSIPEDSFSLYEPLFTFIERYGSEFPKIVINVKLEYANSSTNRSLMTLFEMMIDHKSKGNDVEIAWFYAQNDKEMFDLGSDFKDLLPLSFDLRPVESLD